MHATALLKVLPEAKSNIETVAGVVIIYPFAVCLGIAAGVYECVWDSIKVFRKFARCFEEQDRVGPHNGLTRALLCVAVLGDCGVGKTSLLQQYITRATSTTSPTSGADLVHTSYMRGQQNVTLAIWDVSGSHNGHLSSQFYSNLMGCLLVYDICKPFTAQSLSFWNNKIPRKGEQGNQKCPLVVVGNRSTSSAEPDSPQQRAAVAAAQQWCQEHGDIPHFELSGRSDVCQLDVIFARLTSLALDYQETQTHCTRSIRKEETYEGRVAAVRNILSPTHALPQKLRGLRFEGALPAKAGPGIQGLSPTTLPEATCISMLYSASPPSHSQDKHMNGNGHAEATLFPSGASYNTQLNGNGHAGANFLSTGAGDAKGSDLLSFPILRSSSWGAGSDDDAFSIRSGSPRAA